MTVIEIVIDPHVVLITVVRHSAVPRVTGGVQAISRPEIVRQRHHVQRLLNRSGWVRDETIGVAAEETDHLKIARCGRRFHRIAKQVHCRNRGVKVAVLDAGKESKSTHPGRPRRLYLP